MKDHVDPTLPPEAERQPPSPTLDWAVSSGRVEQVCAEVEARLRRRRIRRMGATAAGVAVLVVAGLVWRLSPGAPGDFSPTAAPAIVVRPAQQLLPDGSRVEIKDGARIAVDYDAARRRVVLREGEALFHVAPNPDRSFVVVAGGVEVRAVGTAFSVQLGAKAVEVVVTEGSVSVESSSASAPSDRRATGPRDGTTMAASAPPLLPASFAPVKVAAGERAIVETAPQDAAPQPSIVALSETDLHDRLAWRIPRLEFSGTPLAKAIPLFNEHAGVRLVLGDASLGGLELSGVMRADNIDSLLRLLRDEFRINAERRGHEIVLRR